jgi:hypothetical protein
MISSVISLGAAPAVLARQALYEGADPTLQLISLAYDLIGTLIAGAAIWAVTRKAAEPVVFVDGPAEGSAAGHAKKSS